MLRRVLAWSAAVLIGVLIGAASAWAVLNLGQGAFVERYGAWRFSRAAGAESAGLYTRAIVAREGLLALSAREALYFTLSEDENGQPLREACLYTLSGGPISARWWSLTLYAADNFLAPNSDNAAAVDATRVGEAVAWQVRIAPVRGEAPYWLSSRAAGHGFLIMLRVYNPQRDFQLSADSLPQLTTLSCPEAGS